MDVLSNPSRLPLSLDSPSRRLNGKQATMKSFMDLGILILNVLRTVSVIWTV